MCAASFISGTGCAGTYKVLAILPQVRPPVGSPNQLRSLMDPEMAGTLVFMKGLEDLKSDSPGNKDLVLVPQESFLSSECRTFGFRALSRGLFKSQF